MVLNTKRNTASTSSTRHLGFFNERMINGVVQKQFDGETLGIAFRDEKGSVVLGKLSARFEKETELVSGLKVLHINGTPVESATQAATLVRSAPAGTQIVVAVDAICLKVTKKWRSDKTGLLLEGSTDGVRVSQVNDKGYFPTLQQGQKLVAINGLAVLNLKHAVNMLTNNKTLSVVVVTEDDETMYSSSHSLGSYSPSSSVMDEVELLEPIHFQMQDFEEEEVVPVIAAQ
jgi:PDZ domain-containing secreted protein